MSFRRRSIAFVSAITVVVAGFAFPAWGDERQDLVDKQQQNAAKANEIKSSLEGLMPIFKKLFLNWRKLVRGFLEWKQN